MVAQLLAKMARRIEKLKRYDTNSDDKRIVVEDACKIISKVRQRINKEKENLETTDVNSRKLQPLKSLKFDEDVHQKVPKLRNYLAIRKKEKTPQQDQIKVKLITTQWNRHSFDSTDPPNLEYFDELNGVKSKEKKEIGTGLILSDFENFVLYKIDLNAYTQYDSVVVRLWSFKYGSIAHEYYKHDDELGMSRMHLTQMKLLAILDKAVTHKHPMYKLHRSGINPAIFDTMLLPHRCDMEIANELQTYFRKRNKPTQTGQKLPGLLESEQITKETFAAKFAASDEEMQDLRKLIGEKDKLNMFLAKKMFDNGMHKLRMMCNRYRRMEHKHTQLDGAKRCVKCKLMVKAARYQKWLPSDENQQNAVVFELMIPTEIACLRDVLFDVVSLFHKEPPKVWQIHEKWTEMPQLSSFNKSTCSERVFLGSSEKSSIARDSQVQLKLGMTFQNFTRENEHNCVYYALSSGLKTHLHTDTDKQSNMDNTFKTEKGSPHSCLEWVMKGNITENEVLANQYNRPKNITLTEYNNFGSLRASGYRLQLHKLLRLIASEGLSFESKSVLYLIMQTM